MDVDRLLEIQRTAFGGKEADWEAFRKSLGDENFRTLGDAGGLCLIPMGQYFGGKSVPMTGIGGVAISPERRGGGAATTLMFDAVKELNAKGVALSALYPTTETLYRRAGYEQAGSQFSLRVDLATLRLRERGLQAERIDDNNRDAVRAIQRTYASGNPGNLDRHETQWQNIGQGAEGFVFGDEAYVYTKVVPIAGEPRKVLRVVDHGVATPAGVRRLLSFLADHESLYRDAVLNVGPSDPLLAVLPEQRVKPLWFDQWMLRITHLPAAITARGYNRHVAAELHLRVADDVVAGNAGDWTVRVADGAAEIEPGGRGEVAIDIRALASLYSGHLSTATLATAGWIEGPPEALAAAQSIFAGPAPWMLDGF
ncbi:MAG: GNAT family N-acetyltransferase [Planctomycetota bacterium]|jgi:predicted acetyltransferase